ESLAKLPQAGCGLNGSFVNAHHEVERVLERAFQSWPERVHGWHRQAFRDICTSMANKDHREFRVTRMCHTAFSSSNRCMLQSSVLPQRARTASSGASWRRDGRAGRIDLLIEYLRTPCEADRR